MAKGKKEKIGKKVKKVKYVPDPDAPYMAELNATYYIPKVFRERRDAAFRQAIEEAITASLVGEPASTLAMLGSGGDKKDPNKIPMANLHFICGTLGLCLSKDQTEQAKAMVALNSAPSTDAADLEAFDRALTSEPPVEMADKSKVIDLLLKMLHTRILSYDAQVLENPHPDFPVRVLSIVYSTNDATIQKCFDALWPACGSQYTFTPQKEKVRCLGVSEVRELLSRHKTTELLFTDEEVQHMVLAFEDAGEDLIREDTFLLVMQDVM